MAVEPKAGDPLAAELVAAELWALGAVGIEETNDGLRAAFTELSAATGARDALAPGADIETVEDTFGLDAGRDRLSAVTAGIFVVHPPWIDPPEGLISLSIDPGHAFGSGSHTSTRLALTLLGEQSLLEGSTVVDIGCGTGVLSIAAARLGAIVLAIDTDPAAIAATTANAAMNGVRDRVTAKLGSVTLLRGQRPADLVLVNVTIDIHEALGPQLPWQPKRMIAAGVLAGRQAQRCAATWKLDIVNEMVDGEWAGLILAP